MIGNRYHRGPSGASAHIHVLIMASFIYHRIHAQKHKHITPSSLLLVQFYAGIELPV